MTETLVIPYSGEVISPDDAEACARKLHEIRELERRLRELKNELTFHLAQEFERQGLKTMDLNGIKAELKGGSEIAWDIEILEELRGLGLPDERFNELVRTEVTYKVSAKEANRIAAANPRYAEVIDRAKQRYSTPVYVSVR